MEEKVGSYVVDESGKLSPNEADEATAERLGLRRPRPANSRKEVKPDEGK